MISFSLKDKFSELWTKLTQIGESEPLSKLAFVAVIFLDIFMLVTIFTGLADHTAQLPTLDQYIPYNCRDMVVWADQKSDSEKINIVRNNVVYNMPFVSEKYDYNQISIAEIHPVCQKIKEDFDVINAKNSDINTLYTTLYTIEQKRDTLQYEINNLKQNYDTAVLEKIANMESEALKMQQEMSQKQTQLADYNRQIQSIQSQILANTTFKGIWEYVLGNNAEKQKLLEHDFAVAEFWYPIKKLLMELAFLLPLFFVFLFWNTRSIRKNSGVQSFISSHLVVIAFIPIFWKILEAIFEIIPKRLIEQLLTFLASFKLLALWYYVLVLVGILIGMLVIYIIQKKIFSRDRLNEKRISHGDCQGCGKHLPEHVIGGAIYCPFCGYHQYKTCPKCKQETFVTAKFCTVCGFKFEKK